MIESGQENHRLSNDGFSIDHDFQKNVIRNNFRIIYIIVWSA